MDAVVQGSANLNHSLHLVITLLYPCMKAQADASIADQKFSVSSSHVRRKKLLIRLVV